MIFRVKLKLLPFVLVISFFFTAGINTYANEKNEIVFSFAPKDGTVFSQKLTMLREKDLGSLGVQLDESESITKVEFKKVKDGWEVLATPVSAVMKRNGQVIQSPVVDLLSKLTITYILDKNGHITDVRGYEKLISMINSKFPPQVAQKLSSLINSDLLKQKEITEWNGRIGDYLGKSISIGDTWNFSAPFQLPNGKSLNYNVKILFSSLEPCGRNKCVKIDQVFDSAADGLSSFASEVVKTISVGVEEDQEKKMPENGNNNSTIQGKITRLIDPSTMLIYKEELDRIIEMEMEIPGVGKLPAIMTEKRIYEFDYQ
jgi:hypothetical protein